MRKYKERRKREDTKKKNMSGRSLRQYRRKISYRVDWKVKVETQIV